MTRLQTVRLILVACIVFVMTVVPVMPAFAQEGECPPDTVCFEAGVACADFALKIDVGSGGPSNQHTFLDKDGNQLGAVIAGRGNAMTYSNLSTGKTISTEANGAVSLSMANPDGTTTIAMMGHNVVILYPTDVPAGPSTSLIVGQVVFTVDPYGVWTLVKTSGKSLDICAALAD